MYMRKHIYLCSKKKRIEFAIIILGTSETRILQFSLHAKRPRLFPPILKRTRHCERHSNGYARADNYIVIVRQIGFIRGFATSAFTTTRTV